MIEGTLLNVCSSCAKFGESGPTKRETKEPPTVARRLERRERRMRTRDVYKGASAEALAADYPARIRSAREKRNLSQKELEGKKGGKEDDSEADQLPRLGSILA